MIGPLVALGGLFMAVGVWFWVKAAKVHEAHRWHPIALPASLVIARKGPWLVRIGGAFVFAFGTLLVVAGFVNAPA